MQSTGHSSTQDLSLTSMHGSAITYVTGSSSSSPACPACWAPVLAADARHFHLRFRLNAAGLTGALLGIPVGAAGPDPGNQLVQLLVGGTRAQWAAQVVPGGGEQARIELAVGGQPGPGAATAERLRDRR